MLKIASSNINIRTKFEEKYLIRTLQVLTGLEIETEIDLKYLNFQKKNFSVGLFQMLLLVGLN